MGFCQWPNPTWPKSHSVIGQTPCSGHRSHFVIDKTPGLNPIVALIKPNINIPSLNPILSLTRPCIHSVILIIEPDSDPLLVDCPVCVCVWGVCTCMCSCTCACACADSCVCTCVCPDAPWWHYTKLLRSVPIYPKLRNVKYSNASHVIISKVLNYLNVPHMLIWAGRNKRKFRLKAIFRV